MMNWLHTIRWKNLLIIWISIIVIILPHFHSQFKSYYFEFILWGIICTAIAAIGNITNDLYDVKQDRANKKKNIFSEGKNHITAWMVILFFLIICIVAILASDHYKIFSLFASGSLLLLVSYNLILKKIALVGNLVIAILTALIFVGMDYIILGRLAYFELGFENKQIELLALFAFTTTIIREIIKDAEDRKGDLFAGFNTIAKFLKDKWIGILIIIIWMICATLVYIVMNKRQAHFTNSFYFYTGWTFIITILAAVSMLSNNPSKYVRATRIVKAGMIGCLGIYLFLSL